jgi:transposase
MARRGKELSSDTNNAIVKLREGGHSGRKISAMLEINPATVQKFLKRFRSRNSVENGKGSGRPKKSSDRTDRQLMRLVKTERRKNLKDITNLLNEKTHVKISESMGREDYSSMDLKEEL